jgi:hypothetical protein
MVDEVLTVVLPMLVLWLVTLLLRTIVSEERAVFSPDDGGSMFSRNVGIYLQVYEASEPRR